MYSTNTKPYKPYSGRNYKPNQRYSETGYQREYEGYKPQNKKYSIQIKFRRSEEKMKFVQIIFIMKILEIGSLKELISQIVIFYV